ncbi:uncharacterized protein LOC128965255 [Oppia nitens]|uniref:uncharacterized protein LOC128965255 n=1 Tax=Oppia nitens TaxID=1686743 RepID=UPI0023DCE7A2|nr:uncharacterized protein LOC128965255 [Oppia nitens]
MLLIVLLLLNVIDPGYHCCQDADREIQTNDDFRQMEGRKNCPGSQHKCPLGPWCCDDHGNARNCPQQECRSICCPEKHICLKKLDNEQLTDLDGQNEGYYCKNDGQNDGSQDGGSRWRSRRSWRSRRKSRRRSRGRSRWITKKRTTHSGCRAICCPENHTCRSKSWRLTDMDKQNQGYYCKNGGQDDAGGQSVGQGGEQGGDQGGGQDEGQGGYQGGDQGEGQDGGQGGYQGGGQDGYQGGQYGGQDGDQGGYQGQDGGQGGGQDGE